MKLAGIITLYHPDKKVLSNIETFLNQLDILYVLDNTENPDVSTREMFSKIGKVEYKAFGGNMGIAYAMNYALKAVKGYDFLLTMDQDSYFLPGMMAKYKQKVEEQEKINPQKAGVYSVNFDPRVDAVVPGCKKIDVAITSGSMIPVDIATKIGGFDENLFIDEVDNEFCYRVKKNGYDILEFPSIILKHSLGHQTFHQILGFHYNTFNHNALRKYYMTRNRIYVLRKYPEIRCWYIKNIIKDVIKVVLAENDKKHKINYIIKGMKDGIINHMGKFTESNH